MCSGAKKNPPRARGGLLPCVRGRLSWSNANPGDAFPNRVQRCDWHTGTCVRLFTAYALQVSTLSLAFRIPQAFPVPRFPLEIQGSYPPFNRQLPGGPIECSPLISQGLLPIDLTSVRLSRSLWRLRHTTLAKHTPNCSPNSRLSQTTSLTSMPPSPELFQAGSSTGNRTQPEVAFERRCITPPQYRIDENTADYSVLAVFPAIGKTARRIISTQFCVSRRICPAVNRKIRHPCKVRRF